MSFFLKITILRVRWVTQISLGLKKVGSQQLFCPKKILGGKIQGPEKFCVPKNFVFQETLALYIF